MIDDQTLHAALEGIRAAGCDSLVMLQPSMGNGQLVFTLSQAWAGPIVLWATPERPGDGKVSSCSLVGQHLWGSMLHQAGHPFEFVYGDPDDAGVKADLARAIAMSRTAMQMKSAKVGMIGSYAPGFVDLAADPFVLRKTLGMQLHALSLLQFVDRVNKIDEAAVQNDVAAVRKLGIPLKDVEDKDLAVNSRVYLAILDLMKEESLAAVSIQCWPELPEVLGQWPYLAISRLTADGHAVSMEGDVDGSDRGADGEFTPDTATPFSLTGWSMMRPQFSCGIRGMAPLGPCALSGWRKRRAHLLATTLQYREAPGRGRRTGTGKAGDHHAVVALRSRVSDDRL